METQGWPFSPGIIAALLISLRQKNSLRGCVWKCISGWFLSFIAVRKHTGILYLLDEKDDASMNTETMKAIPVKHESEAASGISANQVHQPECELEPT